MTSDSIAGIPALATTVAQAQTKFATICCLKFTYTDGGRWHEIEVSCLEMLDILKTGAVDGKQICAVEIVTVNPESEEDPYERVRFVYDFVALNTNKNPWRML